MRPVTVGLVIGATNLVEEVTSPLAELPVRIAMQQREIGDWAAFVEKLEKAEPDLLLLGYENMSDPIADVIRQTKAVRPHIRVVVVHTSADPDTILRVMRAGADEFLYPPLKDDLTQALERISIEIAKERAGTRPRGKVLGVMSAKGGCGATTVTCHLAMELQRVTKLEILIADFDIDSGMIGFLMKTHGRYSILDAVANAHRLDLSFWKALVSNGTPGIEVITAPTSMGAGVTKPLEDFRAILPFVRSAYDWTIADLGRSLTPLAMSLVDELDEMLLVTTLEIPALHRAKAIVQAMLDRGYHQLRLKILLNRMPKRSEVTLEELDRMLGVPIYATIPNDYQALSDAYSEGTLLAPESYLSRNFARIAAKIADIGPAQKKQQRFPFRLRATK